MNKVETFFLHHYKDIFNYVYSVLNDLHGTQEIVQEIFVRLCENIDIINKLDQKKAKDWALEIAHQLSINYMQEEGNYALEGINTASNICNKENLEEKIQTYELRDFIQAKLQKLKIEHQEAIYLVDIQQLSYKESAYFLGITEEAFGSLLKRARQALIRRILKEFNPELLKLPLSIYEQKMLFTWFDVLDYPNDVEEKVSSRIQDFFNGFHQNFDSFRRETYPQGLNNYLMSFVHLNNNTIVADYGSGTGSLIKDVAPLVSEVYAIDHSIDMLKILTDSQKKLGFSNVKTIYTDVCTDLSFLKESVDIGFCCMLLHHVFNPSNAIKQMAQTLVPGGELVIADLTFTNKNWLFKESHDFWTGFKAEQLQKWLEGVDLEIIEMVESEEYKFQFNDLKDKGEYVEVPLLTAHCRKMK